MTGDSPPLGDVRPEHAVDETALASYLESRIPGFEGPCRLKQFAGGQSNLSYLVTAASGLYVLRRKPPGALLKSAHAVDREYRVMTALAATGVPVPKTHILCEDPDVIGTEFFVMDFADGRQFWDPALPALPPAGRAAVYGSMNATLAALHGVDIAAANLDDFGRHGGYVARQISRWTRQYEKSPAAPIPAMEKLIDWLPGRVPPAEDVTLVHGDYRIDNMIFSKEGPQVIAVLDWELSTLGDPVADFAYHCLAYHLPSDILNGLGNREKPAGIPDEADYIAAYAERTGRDPRPHWDFYIAFNLFRLAAIAHGIAGRARTGTAVHERAREAGAQAAAMAEIGWKIANG